MGQLATAAVLRRRDEPFAIEEIELPDPEPGQVLVEIAGAGICHTDLVLREGYLAGDWPIVLGHEGSGIVTAVGVGMPGVAVGDHVVLSFDSCGGCRNCLDGHPAYCATFHARNMLGRGASVGTAGGTVPQASARSGEAVASRWFGQSSFASHVAAAGRGVVVIDRDVPLELAGPLGCGFLTGAGAVSNVLRMRPGDSLVVLGAGSVGMAAALAAASAGAARVVAVDLQQARLDLAGELCATHVIGAQDATEAGRLTEAILDTGGPVTHVLDTTGHPAAIRAAVDALDARGICAVVGVQRHDLVLGPQSLARGRVLTAIYEGDAVPQTEIPRLIELWRQGRFPLEKLVTSYPLAAINDAERDMAAARVLKPVLRP
jgi:aryl-alcohol dehydrogenase